MCENISPTSETGSDAGHYFHGPLRPDPFATSELFLSDALACFFFQFKCR